MIKFFTLIGTMMLSLSAYSAESFGPFRIPGASLWNFEYVKPLCGDFTSNEEVYYTYAQIGTKEGDRPITYIAAKNIEQKDLFLMEKRTFACLDFVNMIKEYVAFGEKYIGLKYDRNIAFMEKELRREEELLRRARGRTERRLIELGIRTSKSNIAIEKQAKADALKPVENAKKFLEEIEK